MNKDIGRYSIHINRHYLSNFALGLDYYQLIDSKTRVLEASILQRAVETMPETQTKAKEYISDHLELARKLHKPVVLEEFGIDRDSSDFRPGTPTTFRDKYY